MSYGTVDTKSLLDIALEGQSEEYRRKVLELAFKGKIQPTDPIFLILLATGRLEVLIQESPKPEDFELAFTRWMGRINKTNTVQIEGNAKLFEGTSEDTTDKEDEQVVSFTVSKGGVAAHHGIQLRSTGTRGGDHAEISLSFTNSLVE